MRIAKRFIVVLGILASSLGSVDASEWEGVCWSRHDDYFAERAEYLNLTYSWLNVNAVRSVYSLGRPTYFMLSRLEDVGFDVVTGLGGGPSGVIASVVIGQGVDVAMALLRDVVETPRDLAAEIGGRTMERGMQALNENYRLYRRNIANLDDATKLAFRQNQVYADLMGPAKELYLAAKEDRSTSSVDPDVVNILSGLETVFASTPFAGAAAAAVPEITDIIRQSGIGLEGYAPYEDYQDSLSAVRDANGIQPCASDGPSSASYPDIEVLEREPVASPEEPPTEEFPTEVPPAPEPPANLEVASVDAFVGGSVTVDGIFEARRATVSGAGFMIELPDGSQLSCMGGALNPAHGCGGRGRSQGGFVENLIVLRGFPDPGTYRIYFNASGSSSSVTLPAGHANAIIDRWPRTASFEGSRTVILDLSRRRIGVGDVVLLAEIVVR